VFKKENIQNVIDDYQVDKEEILYIGDTVSDIQNMQELGVSILSAAYCHKKEEEKKALEQLNPNRVAHSVEELKEMIYKEI
jgi:phosphoglycolate phosphatase-like HAD superfamily hydrolase